MGKPKKTATASFNRLRTRVASGAVKINSGTTPRMREHIRAARAANKHAHAGGTVTIEDGQRKNEVVSRKGFEGLRGGRVITRIRPSKRK